MNPSREIHGIHAGINIASIRGTSSGTFAVIWRSPDHSQKCKPSCAKATHQHGQTFPTRWQAEQFAATAEADELAAKWLGRVVPPKPARRATPDFKSAATSLIDRGGPAGNWAPNTQRNYRSVLSTQLREFYTRSVAEIADDREAVQKLARTTKRPHAVTLLHAVVRDAVSHGLIPGHRLSDISAGTATGNRRDIIEATPAQLDKIAATLDGFRPGLGLTVHLASGCGLRPAETLAVESADFREGCGTLRVQRQVQHGPIRPLKSKRRHSYRDVPVPKAVTRKVLMHIAKHGEGRLFRGPDRGFVSAGKYGHHFRKGAQRAGLPANFTPHQLRHRFASKLQVSRIASDATFPGRRDREAVGA